MFNQKELGDKIAKYRKGANISQTKLANMLGITPQAVSRWETGESLPDIATYHKLSEIFNVSLSELVTNINVDDADEEEEKQDEPKGFVDKVKDWHAQHHNITHLQQLNQVSHLYNFSGFKKSDFSDMTIENQPFLTHANVDWGKFTNTKLINVLIKWSNIDKCNFNSTKFVRSEIRRCNIDKCNFSSTSMEQTYWKSNNVNHPDFRKSNAIETQWVSCNFTKAIWDHSKLTKNQFERNNFSGVRFSNSEISESTFERCGFRKTSFENVTFKMCTFRLSNMKKVLFVDCKMDKFTYNFLRSCAANVDNVELTK